jgi:hypothetical protein
VHGFANLQSDRGGEFCNDLLDAILVLAEQSAFRTTSYNPSTNGKIERFNRTFHGMLAKFVCESQTDWSEYVDHLVFCYNACAHSSTGLSPFFLMYGQHPRWNVDVCLNNPSDAEVFDSLPAYALDLVERMERAYKLVRAHLHVKAEANRCWYDKSVKECSFQEGDRVRVFVPKRVQGRSPKLQSFYKDQGVVLKRLNEVTYLIKCKNWRENRVIHVDKLRPFRRFDEAMQDASPNVTGALIANDQATPVSPVNVNVAPANVAVINYIQGDFNADVIVSCCLQGKSRKHSKEDRGRKPSRHRSPRDAHRTHSSRTESRHDRDARSSRRHSPSPGGRRVVLLPRTDRPHVSLRDAADRVGAGTEHARNPLPPVAQTPYSRQQKKGSSAPQGSSSYDACDPEHQRRRLLAMQSDVSMFACTEDDCSFFAYNRPAVIGHLKKVHGITEYRIHRRAIPDTVEVPARRAAAAARRRRGRRAGKHNRQLQQAQASAAAGKKPVEPAPPSASSSATTTSTSRSSSTSSTSSGKSHWSKDDEPVFPVKSSAGDKPGVCAPIVAAPPEKASQRRQRSRGSSAGSIGPEPGLAVDLQSVPDSSQRKPEEGVSTWPPPSSAVVGAVAPPKKKSKKAEEMKTKKEVKETQVKVEEHCETVGEVLPVEVPAISDINNNEAISDCSSSCATSSDESSTETE